MSFKIQAAIFDMDGLLIDSEPLWKEVEIPVFRNVGVPLTYEMCHETEGMRLDAAVKHWYDRYPWQGSTLLEVEQSIMHNMRLMMAEKGEAMTGVYDILQLFKTHHIPMAVASSSPMSLIEAVVDKLQIRDYFQALCSAKDEKYGKPHPDVFLTAARKLGVDPANCIVFEDASLGVQAANAAGMVSVAVPYPDQYDLPKYDIAHLKIPSLLQFTEEVLQGYL